MTRLVIGTLIGILAAGLRRSPGESLLELPAASVSLGYWGQALALGLAGLTALFARRTLDGRPNELLLLGGTLGVLLEGLGADLRPMGHSSLLPLAPLALALLLVRELRSAPSPPPAVSRPGFVLPLLVAGFGALLAIDPVARVVLRFGGGTRAEGALVLAVSLALAALGGLCFGAPLRGERDRAGSRVALVAAVAVVPLVTLSWLALAGQAIEPVPRREFLGRFGLDRSLEGQLHVTGVIALLGLLLPAFAVGLAISCARRRAELAALFVGAGAGAALLAVMPALEPWFIGPVALTFAGLLGGIEPSRPLRDRSRLPGLLVLGLAATCLVPLSRMHPPPVLGWERFPITPSYLSVSGDGQLLVKPTAPRVAQVLLDRVEVAPRADRAGIDAEQLRTAMSLAPGGARVLLVGQLTPGRAWVLEQEGAIHVDRTAAWTSSMPGLEEVLFEGCTDLLPAEGRVCSLQEARLLIDRGFYDLVVVPAVVGGAPPQVSHLAEMSLPPGTIAVAFVDAGLDLAQRRIGGPVLLVTDGLHHPVLGFVFGAEAPGGLDPGESTPAPTLKTFAFEPPEERLRRARAALMQRLEVAAEGSRWSELISGLAAHFAAQVPSSPWAGRAERTELDRDAMDHLLAAGLGGEPDRLTLGVWGGVAEVLVGKRDVEGIWEWIEPLTTVWQDWFDGQVALAHADLESLDLDAARLRIDAMVEPTQAPARLRWRRLRLALARGYRDAGRDEEARELAEKLLREDPENREAWGLLAPQPPQDR